MGSSKNSDFLRSSKYDVINDDLMDEYMDISFVDGSKDDNVLHEEGS